MADLALPKTAKDPTHDDVGPTQDDTGPTQDSNPGQRKPTCTIPCSTIQ